MPPCGWVLKLRIPREIDILKDINPAIRNLRYSYRIILNYIGINNRPLYTSSTCHGLEYLSLRLYSSRPNRP
jgi:hypothetical protein